ARTIMDDALGPVLSGKPGCFGGQQQLLGVGHRSGSACAFGSHDGPPKMSVLGQKIIAQAHPGRGPLAKSLPVRPRIRNGAMQVRRSVVTVDRRASVGIERRVGGPTDVRERLATIVVRSAAVWKAARIPPVQESATVGKTAACGLHPFEERALATLRRLRK